MKTWSLPLFLALLMLLSASARTFICTMVGAQKDGGKRVRGTSFYFKLILSDINAANQLSF